MRTFIALDLSQDIKAELSRLEDGLKKADADIKWVKPENIHITLKFLGEVDEAKLAGIKQILDGISAQFKPFEITLFKLGAFPSLNYARVVWVGIDKSCAEVEKIASQVEEELEKIGFPKEERPFSAHLTLGRVKSAKNKDKLKEMLASLEARPKSSLIDKIVLYKSTLTPSGPIYTAIHEAPFTPDA